MKTKTPLTKPTNEAVSYRYDGKMLIRCAGILGCSLILMIGFFVAARQHFSMLDWSRKNVKLRQLRDDLINERQRLSFERENALSRENLGKRAEKIGLQFIRAGQVSNLATIFSSDAVSKENNAGNRNSPKAKTEIAKSPTLKSAVAEKH